MIDDEKFMRAAYSVAIENGSDPSLSPIGCVITRHGKVLAARRNKVAEHRDAVAHAEIEAIRAAGAPFENGELRDATLYTTLQPCGMCTMASIWSKVGRIVFGADARTCIRCISRPATSIRWLSLPRPTGTIS
jgi:tRNA(adenine34) deaminase